MDMIALSFLLGVIVLLAAIAGGIAMYRTIVTGWNEEHDHEEDIKNI
jgi:hypothetical protein